SGTSMSTPVVSGAICLLLEKYPFLTPAQVKLRLYQTCVPVGLSKNHEGWGLLNIRNFLTGIWEK
ncbi:MAG: peptidase S8, partial [Lachnospiraceae bacterium]|nr:peptidase S8 [Lachnospiraceae bacterium]